MVIAAVDGCDLVRSFLERGYCERRLAIGVQIADAEHLITVHQSDCANRGGNPSKGRIDGDSESYFVLFGRGIEAGNQIDGGIRLFDDFREGVTTVEPTVDSDERCFDDVAADFES